MTHVPLLSPPRIVRCMHLFSKHSLASLIYEHVAWVYVQFVSPLALHWCNVKPGCFAGTQVAGVSNAVAFMHWHLHHHPCQCNHACSYQCDCHYARLSLSSSSDNLLLCLLSGRLPPGLLSIKQPQRRHCSKQSVLKLPVHYSSRLPAPSAICSPMSMAHF